MNFIHKFSNNCEFCAVAKSVESNYQLYLKNFFKKKKTAATHVLVIAVSDERRSSKPYTLPVQYLPYKSLRDQYIRDITAPLKKTMTDAGLEVVGVVTDGEFNSLRTQGETGPLHIWQLVHNSKEAVRKMSRNTLISMLTYAGGGSFEGEEYKPDTTVDCRTVSPAVLVPGISVSKDVLGTGISVIFDVLDPGILVSKDVLDTGISEITDECDAEISVSVDVIASCKFEPSATELSSVNCQMS